MAPATGGPHAFLSVGERLREEFRKYLVVSLYLWICFAAIQLFKWAVLRDVGVAYLPLGFAAAKALILGKFVLLGDAAHVGQRVEARTLLQRIVIRVALMMVVLVVLIVIEELVAGAIHGRSTGQTLAEYEHRWPEVLATSVLMLLILVPLIVVTEVGRVLGPGGLKRLFLAPADAGAFAPPDRLRSP
jgi:hypothetical protein